MSRVANATKKGRILSVTIHHRLDTDPDLSWIGEFTEKYDDWNIIWHGEQAGKFCNEVDIDPNFIANGCSRYYPYFHPYAAGEKPGTEDFKKYALQDYERMRKYNNQSWWMIGIIAIAKVTLPGSDVIQKITSGGLWGIESDSGDADIQQIENEQLDELKSELELIGFGKRAIAQACKNVETKEE